MPSRLAYVDKGVIIAFVCTDLRRAPHLPGTETMADTDLSGNAWVLPPSQYIRERPPAYSVSPPKSSYLKMSDGCRLAIDLYLPSWQSEEGPWPTILVQTPYYRRFSVDASDGNVEVSPNVAKYRDMFVPRGYALVVLDVRGTGASFGTRDIFRSPKERDDAYQVVEWIVAQDWSNGSIGASLTASGMASRRTLSRPTTGPRAA